MVKEVEQLIWNRNFAPRVFKKVRKEDKAKGVDIALTIDMLSHAFMGNYDTAMLIAGDADYVPLVNEVKHLGKRVVVLFFETSITSDLKLAADAFSDISNGFSLAWKDYTARLRRKLNT